MASVHLQETVQAARVARDQSRAAAALERQALHDAAHLGRGEGMGVRPTASALQVPFAKVARHLREVPSGAGRGAMVADSGGTCRHLPLAGDNWAASLEHFSRTRAVADAARFWEGALLSLALVEGVKGEGFSVRHMALLLGMPVATTARAMNRAKVHVPVWSNGEAVLSMERRVWGHAPSRVMGLKPFEWVGPADSHPLVRVDGGCVAKLFGRDVRA